MSKRDHHKELAAALGRVASGLFIVTFRRDDAETGLLASWVQQCSFDPPGVTIAIKKGRPVSKWLQAGTLFAVNILDDAQTDMIVHFGRGFELSEPAFDNIAVDRPSTGAPVLREALAYLQCRIVSTHSVGDHDLAFGEVVDGRLLNDGQPMIHIRKNGLHY